MEDSAGDMAALLEDMMRERFGKVSINTPVKFDTGDFSAKHYNALRTEISMRKETIDENKRNSRNRKETIERRAGGRLHRRNGLKGGKLQVAVMSIERSW
jgi:hypothetical protein